MISTVPRGLSLPNARAEGVNRVPGACQWGEAQGGAGALSLRASSAKELCTRSHNMLRPTQPSPRPGACGARDQRSLGLHAHGGGSAATHQGRAGLGCFWQQRERRLRRFFAVTDGARVNGDTFGGSHNHYHNDEGPHLMGAPHHYETSRYQKRCKFLESPSS